MNAESIREYCLLKSGVTESFPFGIDTLVFKVREKIFLLIALDQKPLQFNAKCDPDKAVEWREQYRAIQPGYHMNKKLWNTITIDGSLSNQLIKKLIDDSYLLIVKSLPRKAQEGLL